MKKVRIKGLGDREFEAYGASVLIPPDLIEPVPEYREVRWPEDYGKEVEVGSQWRQGHVLIGKRLDGEYVTSNGPDGYTYTWQQARIRV